VVFGSASIVLFGTYDAAVHLRVAVLRDGLRASGHNVVELNVPLGQSTADRIEATRSAKGALGLALSLTRSWLRLIALRVKHRGRPDAVVVGYLGHFDIHLARLLYPRSTIVLDHMVGLADTAKDRKTGSGGVQRLLALLDKWAASAADIIVVDTDEHIAVVSAEHRGKCVVVPVGADDRWFDAAEALTQPDPLATPMTVGFAGLFTPLQGTPTIGEAIGLLADRDDISFTMVGTGQDHAATVAAASANNHVQWVDWIAPADLPAETGRHHVALGIFGTGPKAERVVPHKVFQALAVGAAVITSDTAPQRRALEDAASLCPPGDAAALAAAIALLADDRSQLADLRAASTERSAEFRPDRCVAALAHQLAPHQQGVPVHHPRQPALALNAWLRWDLVQPLVAAVPPGKVLEIGPGKGAIAARLTDMGHDYTGAEMADVTRTSTATLLAARGATARMVASTDDLDPTEQFDLVCAFEVIEHIEDDAAALTAWASMVAPGGTLVISTPADPDRFGAADEAAGHFRRYPAEVLAQLARDAGLSDVTVRHYGSGLGDVLEMGRNFILGRRLRKARQAGDGPELRERTEASSSMLQPPESAGAVTKWLTAPARHWQRKRPTKGPGLVLVGRKSAS